MRATVINKYTIGTNTIKRDNDKIRHACFETAVSSKVTYLSESI